MRTTLNLDDDVLLIAKQIAARERIPIGQAVSQLVRRGVAAGADGTWPPQPLRGRFALLPARDEIITPEHIRELVERDGI